MFTVDCSSVGCYSFFSRLALKPMYDLFIASIYCTLVYNIFYSAFSTFKRTFLFVFSVTRIVLTILVAICELWFLCWFKCLANNCNLIWCCSYSCIFWSWCYLQSICWLFWKKSLPIFVFTDLQYGWLNYIFFLFLFLDP